MSEDLENIQLELLALTFPKDNKFVFNVAAVPLGEDSESSSSDSYRSCGSRLTSPDWSRAAGADQPFICFSDDEDGEATPTPQEISSINLYLSTKSKMGEPSPRGEEPSSPSEEPPPPREAINGVVPNAVDCYFGASQGGAEPRNHALPCQTGDTLSAVQLYLSQSHSGTVQGLAATAEPQSRLLLADQPAKEHAPEIDLNAMLQSCLQNITLSEPSSNFSNGTDSKAKEIATNKCDVISEYFSNSTEPTEYSKEIKSDQNNINNETTTSLEKTNYFRMPKDDPEESIARIEREKLTTHAHRPALGLPDGLAHEPEKGLAYRGALNRAHRVAREPVLGPLHEPSRGLPDGPALGAVQKLPDGPALGAVRKLPDGPALGAVQKLPDGPAHGSALGPAQSPYDMIGAIPKAASKPKPPPMDPLGATCSEAAGPKQSSQDFAFVYHVPENRPPDFYLPPGYYHVIPDTFPLGSLKQYTILSEQEARALYAPKPRPQVLQVVEREGSKETSRAQPRSRSAFSAFNSQLGKTTDPQEDMVSVTRGQPRSTFSAFNAQLSKATVPQEDMVSVTGRQPRSTFSAFNAQLGKATAPQEDVVRVTRAPQARGRAKVFCNMPLQVLKKGEDEPQPSSHLAYGDFLMDIAGAKEEENEWVPNIPLEEDPPGRASDPPSVVTKRDGTVEEQYSCLLNMFPAQDTMYLRQKLEECEGDEELYKRLVEAELLRAQQMEDQYDSLLRLLPDHDARYLHAQCSEMKGDTELIEQFVAEEQMKAQVSDTLARLTAALPDLDTAFLRRKAETLVADEEAVTQFIEEEERKAAVDLQYQRMVAALPSMDPAELRVQCEQMQGDPLSVTEFIDERLAEINLQAQRNEKQTMMDAHMAEMALILPDADPEFLRNMWEEVAGDVDAFNTTVFQLLETRDYPRVAELDAAGRQRLGLWRQFVEAFSVQEFLAKVPAPQDRFGGCGPGAAGAAAAAGNLALAITFLESRYPDLTNEELEDELADHGHSLAATCSTLDVLHAPVVSIDPQLRTEKFTEDFLLEVVYIVHKERIEHILSLERAARETRLREARSRQELLTCGCCFEDEVLATDAVTCPEGHVFCKECLVRACETQLSDSRTSLPCLGGCEAEFTLATMERVLPAKVFTKLLQHRQLAEIKLAQLPDVEECPFCDFAYVPTPGDRVFQCQNEACLMESCRLCKEQNHVPLRCDEVEKPRDVTVRTMIEETMTAALVRLCPSCGKKIVKVDGCNKVACSCGTAMCYVCRRPVQDYSHFNGQGGTKYHLCPLFSGNDELHVAAVRTAGVRARDEALRDHPEVNLVYDPTVDL